jgi:DNA-binding beta-propeller fold protein YncE
MSLRWWGFSRVEPERLVVRLSSRRWSVLALLVLGSGLAQTFPALGQVFFTTQGYNSADYRVMNFDLNAAGSTLFSGSPFGNPNGLAVDASAGKIYVADGTGGQAIRVMSENGSGVVSTLVSVGINVSGLVVDALDQLLYFTTQSATAADDRVMRVSLNGSGLTTLFSGAANFSNPDGLAVDVNAGKIFVADGTGGQSIKVGNLNGSGSMTTLLSVGINVTGLALDEADQLIYFTTSSSTPADDRLMPVGYNGTGATTLFSGSSAFSEPTGLALDLANGKIYVADGTGGHALKVVNLDGSGTVTTLFDPGVNVSGVAVVPELSFWGWISSVGLLLFILGRRGRRKTLRACFETRSELRRRN